MSLHSLLGRKQLTIVGMNSGTSADGLDLAALRFSNSGKQLIKFLDGTCVPYPREIRQAVLTMCDSERVALDEVIYLDNLLGSFYGQSAAKFMERLKRRGISVDVVASHGQTIRHLPRKTKYLGQPVHGTLQIGSLEMVATITGRTVVGDFRQADVALGHEGAPITVAAMAQLFGDRGRSRVIVNIGGMANYFYFPAGTTGAGIRAADTGPGNVISDLLSRSLFNKRYDRNGSHAARGQISEKLFQSTFGQSLHAGTKSTGREQFGEKLASALAARGKAMGLSKNDIMATAIEGTIRMLVRQLRPILAQDRTLDKLYLTGGGMHNSFLVKRLRHEFAPCRVVSVSELGFDPDLVEAAAYAVMGNACLRSEPTATQFGSTKTAEGKPVCGRIVQPPK